jgi:hypothetical protein
MTIPRDLHVPPSEYNPRVIHDTATLRFDRGMVEFPWVVASIVPTPGTGEAHILGAVIMGGALVDPTTLQPAANPQLGFRERGGWALVAALEGDVGREGGTYAWDEPFGDPMRATRMDHYDVFSDMNRGRRAGAGGGIIVTRYDAAQEGKKPFREVSLVPPAWHETVQETFDRFRRSEAPFAPTMSADDARTLLDTKAPLTAVAAFRWLVLHAGFTPDELRDVVLAAAGYLRAVYVFLVVHHATDERTAVQRISSVIEAAEKIVDLVPVVAGFSAAGLFSQWGSRMRDVTKELRTMARARVERNPPEGEMDPFLRRVLYR